MTHPERQRLFAALDALGPREWRDLIDQLLPIVQGYAFLIDTPAVQRLCAIVQAEHEQT